MASERSTAWSAAVWGNAPVPQANGSWHPHMRLRLTPTGTLEADAVAGDAWTAPGTRTLGEQYSMVRIPNNALQIDGIPTGLEIEDPEVVEVYLPPGWRRLSIGQTALAAIQRLNTRLGIDWKYEPADGQQGPPVQIGKATVLPNEHSLSLVRGSRIVNSQPFDDRDILAAELRAALAFELDHHWRPESHVA